MSFPNLAFTEEGKALQLKSMNGDSIIFTKIGIGNGEKPLDISKLTQLSNKLYDCGITKFENKGGYATIHWSLDTKIVENGFDWTEYGIFAKDSSNNEVLYAYAYDNMPQSIPTAEDSSITQIETDVNVALGDSENVTAIIGEYSAYASKEVVEKHLADFENPHKVTANQVGLGNVDNVSTNDATPTFTASTDLNEINSGDKVSTLWGKVKTAVKALIDHINNKNNPHGITVAKIGAAASSHTHNASNINSGILPVARGGTGVGNLNDFKKAINKDVRVSYRSSVSYSPYVYNFYEDIYSRMNNIAFICCTFQINKELGQDVPLNIMKLPDAISPYHKISVIGATNEQGSCPFVSIGIGEDGNVNIYSFGYERLPKGTHIRFQAVYPVA